MKKPSLKDFQVRAESSASSTPSPPSPPPPPPQKPAPKADSPPRKAAEKKKPKPKKPAPPKYRQVNVMLTEQAATQLGHLAVDSGKTRKELIADAVNLLFAQHDKPQVA